MRRPAQARLAFSSNMPWLNPSERAFLEQWHLVGEAVKYLIDDQCCGIASADGLKRLMRSKIGLGHAPQGPRTCKSGADMWMLNWLPNLSFKSRDMDRLG